MADNRQTIMEKRGSADPQDSGLAQWESVNRVRSGTKQH